MALTDKLKSIANKIREYTEEPSTKGYTLDTMATEGILNVYNAGENNVFNENKFSIETVNLINQSNSNRLFINNNTVDKVQTQKISLNNNSAETAELALISKNMFIPPSDRTTTNGGIRWDYDSETQIITLNGTTSGNTTNQWTMPFGVKGQYATIGYEYISGTAVSSGSAVLYIGINNLDYAITGCPRVIVEQGVNKYNSYAETSSPANKFIIYTGGAGAVFTDFKMKVFIQSSDTLEEVMTDWEEATRENYSVDISTTGVIDNVTKGQSLYLTSGEHVDVNYITTNQSTNQ